MMCHRVSLLLPYDLTALETRSRQNAKLHGHEVEGARLGPETP